MEVAITKLSARQEDCLTVLLTGRNRNKFSSLVCQMVTSRHLEFDFIVLKPDVHPNSGEDFESTISFKLSFLEDLLNTYSLATEMHIYEDRAPHCKAFKDFAAQYNDAVCLPTDAEEGEFGEDLYDSRTRRPVNVEVIQVAELQSTLNPLIEVTEVQKMVNDHNLAVLSGNALAAPLKIRKTIFYTGYMLSPALTAELLKAFAHDIATPQHDGEIKYLANSILIVPRPCPKAILERVGGMGAEVEFVVTAFGSWADKIWAVKVEPTNPSIYIHTETPDPAVILAHRRSCRPMDANRIKDWHAIPPTHHARIVFKAVVGERMYLKIDEDQLYGKNRHEGWQRDDINEDRFEHASGSLSHGGNHRSQKRRFQERGHEFSGQPRGNHGGTGSRGRTANRQFRGRDRGGLHSSDHSGYVGKRW